ncbi:MAG: TIM barrel protein [Victivallales bacterium]
MSTRQLSFSTFPYMNYKLEYAIERLASWGYQAVELWGGRPHAYAYDLDRDHIRSIKKALNANKMTVSAFIPAQFRYPVSLCIDDMTIRQSSIEYIKKSIDASSDMEIGIVTVCPGHSVYPQSFDSAWNHLKNSLDELTIYAAGKGITLALEPAHPMETDLIQTSDDALRILKELNQDNLKILLDIGHLNVNKEPFCDAVRKLKDYLVLIHLDDNHGIFDEHLIPGYGNINYMPIFKEFANINYDNCVTLELGYNYTTAPDEAAYESFNMASNFIRNV